MSELFRSDFASKAATAKLLLRTISHCNLSSWTLSDGGCCGAEADGCAVPQRIAKAWLKSKNRASAAARRERKEHWR